MEEIATRTKAGAGIRKTSSNVEYVPKNKTKIGMIGWGDYTTGLWSLTGNENNSQHFERHLYSHNNARRDYRDFRELYGEVFEKSETYVHGDIETLLLDSDIVVVATGGPPGSINYEDFIERGRSGDFEKELYLKNYKSVTRVLEALREIKFEGLICMISNPEWWMDRAIKYYGIDPYKIFSVVNDGVRAAKVIGDDLRENGTYLNVANLKVRVIGPHSSDIVVWNEMTYGDIGFLDMFPQYTDISKQKEIMTRIRRKGLEIVTASRNLNTSYIGSQIQLANVLKAIHFKKNLEDYTLEVFVPGIETFIMWPAEFIFERDGNVSVFYDDTYHPNIPKEDQQILLNENKRRQHEMSVADEILKNCNQGEGL